jgi:hypothetical protein
MGARPIHTVGSLSARADLFKCAGRDLSACSTCTRKLAPDAGAGQRWIERLSTGETCGDHADVDRFASLYSAQPACPTDCGVSGGQPK